MKLSLVFRNIVLQTVDRLCPLKRTGRPRTLGNEEALDSVDGFNRCMRAIALTFQSKKDWASISKDYNFLKQMSVYLKI